jgi:hypothetical protein
MPHVAFFIIIGVTHLQMMILIRIVIIGKNCWNKVMDDGGSYFPNHKSFQHSNGQFTVVNDQLALYNKIKEKKWKAKPTRPSPST